MMPTTLKDARGTFNPATAVERELLAECVSIAAGPDGCGDVGAVLADAVKFWSGPGRSIRPRHWKARVNAARRMLDRAVIGSR